MWKPGKPVKPNAVRLIRSPSVIALASTCGSCAPWAAMASSRIRASEALASATVWLPASAWSMTVSSSDEPNAFHQAPAARRSGLITVAGEASSPFIR
jgi:hypothetical protein